MNKHILQTDKAPISRSMGPHVRQVVPSTMGDFDPFVFLDHFGPIVKKPGGLGVPPHPHAGIATITYLFEGSNRHQDSYGHDAVIQAGDLAWMQAGKGIVHAEGINENKIEDEVIHGLQFWISLPAKDKFIEPDFFHYASSDLPSFKLKKATVKVIAGKLFNHESPVKSLSPAFIIEVKIPANEQIDLPIAKGDSCGLYMIEGIIISDDKELLPETLTRYDETGNPIQVKAIEDSHFILFGGTPLNEPIVGYASYVMNNESQILQVIKDYQLGKMGNL
jgi:redox-sensitive bicupin YhaK (pirin superfamily)